MKKDILYERLNYKDNKEYLNNIDEHKNWIFNNYINNKSGEFYKPKYYEGTISPLSQNYKLSKGFNNINSKEFQNNNYLNSMIKINNNINMNHIDMNNINKKINIESFYDFNRKEKEIQKINEKGKYRRDLLNQIEENEKRRRNKKKEIDEENKINEIKYKEYLLYKQKQDEEFENIKKLNKNKKLKSQFNIENQNNNVLLNKIEDNKIKKEEIKKMDKSEEINKERRKERKKEEITENYNRIIRSNNYNMFEEKEELKNYLDKEYQDFLFFLDDNINDEKGKEITEKNIVINNDLKISNNIIKYKNENQRYNIYNKNIQKNIDKKYKYVFEQISYINDYTKSYKMKITPKNYFNHKIDILLDSYSNMILYNDTKKDNYIKDKINKLNVDIKNEEAKEIINNEKDMNDKLNEKGNNQTSLGQEKEISNEDMNEKERK